MLRAVIEGAKRAVAASLACLGGVAILAALAYYVGPIERLDAEILSELTASPGSAASSVASVFERLADWLPQLVLVILASLIALRLGHPRGALVAVALVAGVAVATQILKIALAHPRYHAILGDRQVSSTGFPSGHAAGALSVALAFLFVVPPSWRTRTAAIGAILTFAVSASLLVLGLHYPSDVLAGWLVTVGWCLALVALYRQGQISLQRS